MRHGVSALAALLLVCACTQPHAGTTAQSDIRTIENTPINSLPVQPPPTLDDVVAPPQTTTDDRNAPTPAATGTDTTGTSPADSRQEELSRKMNLPFAPAIAMDPVDGGKVSITPETPIAEYKNRLYYFGSVKNRQAFVSNPEQYLGKRLAAY